MLKTCLNGVYGLPTADTPDKVKEEEALDPQQREVRIKYRCLCTSLGTYLRSSVRFKYKVCFSLQCFSLSPPQVLYSDTFNALHELLRNVLARDLSPDGLQAVFKVKEKL